MKILKIFGIGKVHTKFFTHFLERFKKIKKDSFYTINILKLLPGYRIEICKMFDTGL